MRCDLFGDLGLGQLMLPAYETLGAGTHQGIRPAMESITKRRMTVMTMSVTTVSTPMAETLNRFIPTPCARSLIVGSFSRWSFRLSCPPVRTMLNVINQFLVQRDGERLAVHEIAEERLHRRRRSGAAARTPGSSGSRTA